MMEFLFGMLAGAAIMLGLFFVLVVIAGSKLANDE